MKKLLLALLIGASSLQAAVVAVSNLAATNTAVIATPAIVQEITFFSTNTVPTIIQFFDGSLTVTNAAWTNYTASVSTEVEFYVTTTGITNTWTNTVINPVASEHAAETVARTPVFTAVVPANNVPITVPVWSRFTYSVQLSNNLAGVSGIIKYRLP